VTRLLFYISLLLLPLSCLAWQDVGVDTVVIGDSVTVDEYGSGDYDEDSYEEEHTAATPPPPAVYLKKSFDTDFKKRYTGDDFNYVEEKAADKDTGGLLAGIRNILKRAFGDSEEAEEPDNNGINFPIFELLAILAILGVVYFVARAIMQKESYWIFGRSSKSIATKDLTVENLHEMDFATLISQTKSAQDYRLALRYYYLWLLKKMAARNVIDWNWEKTNSDYYYEIRDNALRDDFKYLSYVYDYSWYGEFPIDEKSFGKAEAAFQKTLNTI
jgi:hypothetical protein